MVLLGNECCPEGDGTRARLGLLAHGFGNGTPAGMAEYGWGLAQMSFLIF